MNIIKRVFSLPFMALIPAILLAVSCSVEEPEQPTVGTDNDELRYVEVGLNLNVAPEQTGTPDAIIKYATKAVDDPENSAETEIKNVCVFQFVGTDDSAAMIGTVEYLEDYDADDPSRSTVKLVASSETCTVVVLANTFSQISLSGENQTLGGIKQRLMGVGVQSDLFSVDTTATASGTIFPDDKDYHLMFNGMTQTPVTETMSSLSVSLKRNIARIDFNVKNLTTGAEAVTITDVRIFNVPKVSYFFTNYPDAPTANFPTVATLSNPTFGLNQEDYAPMEWEEGKVISANERSFRFYVPANQRGTAANTLSSFKPSADPDGCSTYVQVDGVYGESHIPVSYRFYLGANMVDDFNLIPNHTYVYNIEINDKGDAANDPRMEDWGAVDFTPANVERANCYILNPPPTDGYFREFRIPVDRANMFWCNSEPNVGGYMYEDTPEYALNGNTEWVAYPIWSDFELTESNFRIVKNTGTGKSDWFTVAIPQGVSGNIVIGIRRNDDPAILWSWHLWVTDYNPDSAHQAATAGKYIYPVTGGDIHRYTDTGKFFMDRSLGALSTSYVGSGRGALYYQFGRKDPFWGSNAVYFYKLNADGSTYSLDRQSATLPKASGGANKVPASVNNPTTIYTGQVWTSSDQYNPATYDSSILWQDPTTKTGGAREGQKSIFDPCPVGWRVPSSDSWSAFTLNNTSNPTTNIKPPSTGMNRGFPAFNGTNIGLYFYPYVQNTDGSYTVPDKLIYYPASGIRYTSGNLQNVGSTAACWSQSPNGNSYGRTLTFGSTYLNNPGSDPRTAGFRVRCVAE